VLLRLALARRLWTRKDFFGVGSCGRNARGIASDTLAEVQRRRNQRSTENNSNVREALQVLEMELLAA